MTIKLSDKTKIIFLAAVALVITIIVTIISIDACNADSKTTGAAPLAPQAQETRIPTSTHAVYISESVSSEPETVAEPKWTPDPLEAEAIAKVLYRECRGVESDAEKAAVAWCILNRVDSGERYFPDTVIEVVTQKNQFAYYEDTPVWSNLYFLAEDVLTRWHNEKRGDKDVGRTLPKEYLYFTGDGKHNNFTVEWLGKEYWDWSLPDPYES